MNNWPAAEEQWRQVVAEQPDYAPGWRGLGEACLYQGNLAEATRIVGAMVTRPRLAAEIHLLRSRIAAAQRDLAAARRELGEARRVRPDDLDILKCECQFLFEQGDLPSARSALEELDRRAPDDGATPYNLGLVYMQQNELDRAIEQFQISLQRRPEYPPTYRQLGHACNQRGWAEQGREAWCKLLQLIPGDAEAIAQLTANSS
jgi:predicted Zn-dependent protease